MPSKATKTSKTKRTTARRSNPAPAPRRQRPVFGVGTWVAVFLLIFLIAATVYLNQREDRSEAEATPITVQENAYVFENEGILTSMEVKPAEGETVRLERNEENAWVLILPFATEADQGLAEAAAVQVNALRIINELESDPASLGLDAPAFLITVEFAGGEKHTIEVGEKTPTNVGYYVRLNGQRTLIVAASGIDSLINLTLFPPYLNTPTPTPTATATPLPTETPAPPTETESTPEAAETPQP
jgi:hypothetical protein